MFYSIRRLAASVALCFVASSFALTANALQREPRDREPVLRRVVRIVRGIITTGDTMTPPQPAPKP